MGAGPSIIASIGADTAPLKRDLASAEREVERSAQRMARAHEKGVKKLGGAIGGGAFGFGQDVVGAFGLAGGATAAVALLIPKLAEVQEEAKKAKDSLEWLTMPVQAASHAKEEDLLGRIEAINQALRETSTQPNPFKAALGGLSRGLDELFGGTSDQVSPDERAQRLLTARQKAEERLAEVRDLAKQAEMRKDANQMDADAQKQGAARRKELSELANKEAAQAIENIKQEKSAEIELGNVRSEQAGDRYEAEQKFQDLAEKGREKMLRDIREEEAERKKAADNIAKAFKDAQDAKLQELHDDFIEGEMGGADFRRERTRERRKAGKAEAKFKRIRDLAARGGRSIADAPELPPEVGPAKPVKPEATLDATNNLLTEILKATAGWVKSQ